MSTKPFDVSCGENGCMSVLVIDVVHALRDLVHEVDDVALVLRVGAVPVGARVVLQRQEGFILKG